MNEKEIRWRLRRGMRELDLMLSGYHDRRWGQLSQPQRQAFGKLLAAEDDTLWDWLSGRARPPDENLASAIDDIRQHPDG